MPTSTLRFTQYLTVGDAGEALVGTVGTQVDIDNATPGDIGSWEVELLPSSNFGGALAPGVKAGENNGVPAYSFTPDVSGSYRFMLSTWSGANKTGVRSTDIRNFIVPEANGYIVPPPMVWPLPLPPVQSGIAGAKPHEMNFAGQAGGWGGLGADGLLSALVKGFYPEPPGSGTFTLQSVDGVLGWGSPGGGGGHVIQEDAVSLDARANLRFIGTFFDLLDNGGADATEVRPSGNFGSLDVLTLGQLRVGSDPGTIGLAPQAGTVTLQIEDSAPPSPLLRLVSHSAVLLGVNEEVARARGTAGAPSTVIAGDTVLSQSFFARGSTAWVNIASLVVTAPSVSGDTITGRMTLGPIGGELTLDVGAASFGSSIVSTTGGVALGSGTVSGVGLVRVAHAQTIISGKDNGGTDRTLFAWGAVDANTVEVGSNAPINLSLNVGVGQQINIMVGNTVAQFLDTELKLVSGYNLNATGDIISGSSPALTGDLRVSDTWVQKVRIGGNDWEMHQFNGTTQRLGSTNSAHALEIVWGVSAQIKFLENATRRATISSNGIVSGSGDAVSIGLGGAGEGCISSQNASGSANFRAINQNTGSALGASIELVRSRSGATIITGDAIGNLRFAARDDASHEEVARIAVVAGTVSGGTINHEMEFWTGTQTSALTKRLSIDSAGIIAALNAVNGVTGARLGGQKSRAGGSALANDALFDLVANAHNGTAFADQGMLRFYQYENGTTSRTTGHQLWLHDGSNLVKTSDVIERRATVTSASNVTLWSITVPSDSNLFLHYSVELFESGAPDNRLLQEWAVKVTNDGTTTTIQRQTLVEPEFSMGTEDWGISHDISTNDFRIRANSGAGPDTVIAVTVVNYRITLGT